MKAVGQLDPRCNLYRQNRNEGEFAVLPNVLLLPSQLTGAHLLKLHLSKFPLRAGLASVGRIQPNVFGPSFRHDVQRSSSALAIRQKQHLIRH